MKGFLIFLIGLFFALPAQAKPLVADLSSHDIRISAEFTGTTLLLFGVRNKPGDLVVIVRGPAKDFIVRKKSRVGGIWVNRDQVRYDALPSFYAIASTRPLNVIKNPGMLQALQIGQHSLPMFSDIVQPGSQLYQSAEAYLRQMRASRLYSNQAGNLTFMGETLFKTLIEFPDIIPRGVYTAEVYLIYEGQIVSMQSTPILINKVGFDAYVYDVAHNTPVLYGLLAIALAALAGWVVSSAFNRLYA